MPATLADARDALRRVFGYPDFRGMQPRAIAAVLAGRDVLVLMPTGGGKSLCFQVPALVLPGLTLVVSPLISLMQDQVEALERRGVPASFVNSTLEPAEAARRLAAAAAGGLRLLYVAPERFDSPVFRDTLPRLPVSLLAIDEAHCISEWGHGFRPSYLRLGTVRARLRCPCIALTATATPEVSMEIRRRLGLRDPEVLVGGFDRPNLRWAVVSVDGEEGRDRALIRLVRDHRARGPGVAVVYTATRRTTDAVADRLNRAGVPALAYHAGVDGPERSRLQRAFMDDGAAAVVATSAFGMGIDKPDVRLVVHHHMSASLESYYQEAGRAGRDGAPADCVLLHAQRDRLTHEFLIRQGHPPRRSVLALWRALGRLADGDAVVRAPSARLLQAAPSLAGEGQLEAALRVLSEAGALSAGVGARTEVGRDAEYRLRLLRPAHASPPVDWGRLEAAVARERRRLDAMEGYVYARGCRRAHLLAYYGEESTDPRCGTCDRCGANPLAGSRPPRRSPRHRVGAALRRLAAGR